MTATWELESSDQDVSARLSFYTGPSGLPPNYETYVVSIGNTTRKFNNHHDADKYALAHGVTAWHLLRHNKAFPFAAEIPIRFDNAPDESMLSQLIANFESGESLNTILNELKGEVKHPPISPGILRMWFLGTQPRNSKLASLRPKWHIKSASNAE